MIIDEFEKIWFGHEKDNVDVAITPFVPILNYIHKQGVQIFYKSIPDSLIPNEESLKRIDAIEEVLFIGYPCGLWDQRNFIPIVRKGVTATPIYIDFNGEKQFLIDASVFPGSSGSPVFLYNVGTFWDRKTKATVVGNRLLFLGILSHVFQMPDTGEVIISSKNMPLVKTKQLLDIGIVFKAETIIETIRCFLKSKNIL